MKITPLGAASGEVTVSAYMVETDRAEVLIDCGLFQGARNLENFNRLPGQRALQELDAVVLTHAHLDHTGRLPLLTRFEYANRIFATPATIDLTDFDSARCGVPAARGRQAPESPSHRVGQTSDRTAGNGEVVDVNGVR